MKKGDAMSSHLKDEQLIKAISRNDKNAELILINRYKRDAFFIAQSFFAEHKGSGITLDEYYAVTLSEIVPAARRYKIENGVRFPYYFAAKAKNALREYDCENSYLRDAKAFAGDVSLDVSESENDRTKAEELGDIDPFIKGGIEVADILKVFRNVLQGKRKKCVLVYLKYISGCSMKNIAKEMNLHLSSVYRIIDSISSSIKNEIDK